MLRINDKVIDRKGHIFYVDSVIKKDLGSGEKDYYLMYPFFKEDFIDNYMSFVPVENSETLYKKLLTKQEALNLIDSLTSIEPYDDVPPRNRKAFFESVIATTNRYDICRIIKSLYVYRQEKALIKKALTEYESKLLINLKKLMVEELSLSLDMNVDEVPPFVENRINFAFF